MKFIIKKDNDIIKSFADYKDYCRPVSEKQLKKGYSAYEFEKYLCENNESLPKEVEEILEGNIDDESILYPEKLTRFGDYGMDNRWPRHHDGLLIYKDGVVGIEAKVKEPLGNKYLSQCDNSKKRYNTMKDYLFGEKQFEECNVRYQLCSMTIATIIEAINHEKENAIVLVITFKNRNKPNSLSIERNEKDIENFKNLLKHVKGDQYEIPFLLNDETKKIKLFIKSIVVDFDE